MQGNPTPNWSNIGTIPTLLNNLGSLSTTGLIEHTGSGVVSTLAPTTIGRNLLAVPTPGSNHYLRVTSAGLVETLATTDFRNAIGAGTVTSVGLSGGTTGLTITGSPITTAGTLTLAGTLAVANGGTGATTASAARTNLGASTVGSNLLTLSNPGVVSFLRINADHSVDTRNAANFRVDIGAGTVTSVQASGGSTGLTFTGGPITASGTLTLGGTLAVAFGGTGATNAANARTNLGAAATNHTHFSTDIPLTPINSFTAVNGNVLSVFPALGLAVIFFSVSRSSVPANGTNIFSWSSTYTSLDNTRISVFGLGAANVDALHLFLSGNTLQFFKLSGPATAYDIIEGQIMFRYTP